MDYNFEVFRHQYGQVQEFVWHLWFYRSLERQLSSEHRKIYFLQQSSKAHLHIAVVQWTKVFGSFNEKTHWVNLSAKNSTKLRKSFREGVSKALNCSISSWVKYQELIVNFRDKFVAHTDIDREKMPYPKFDMALGVACFYDDWIRELIAPDEISGRTMRQESAYFENRSYEEVARILAGLKT